MDLNTYIRVLWRFRVVTISGFILAVLLGGVSMAKFSFNGGPTLSYRQQPTYQATTRLLVTQKGFPWGRSILPGLQGTTPDQVQQQRSGMEFADPNRFATLAVLYAQLLNGELLQARLRKRLPSGVLLGAQPVTNSPTNAVLPLVDVMGTAGSQALAERTSKLGASLFQSYIANQQGAAKIEPSQRVLLDEVSTQTLLVAGRKKTIPIIAFLTVMIGTIGLAFLLENMRPRAEQEWPEKKPDELVRPEELAQRRNVG